MKVLPSRFVLLILAPAGAAGILLSCSSRQPQPSPEETVVWPAPPAKARIQYVASTTRPSELGATSRGLSRFFALLTGSEKSNEPFEKPFSLALDEEQNLVLGDTGANTVGFLDTKNRRWHRWRAVGGRAFRSPVAVAKHQGLIYVADSEAGEVVAFDLKGAVKRRFTEKLLRPCGVALRGNQLIVADSQAHAVFIFNLDGRFESQIGVRGNREGEFNFPTHVATDSQGLLYVADSMNKRVQVFDATGKFLRQIGSPGDSPGHFGCPKGLAADSEGHVFVLDAVFDCLQIFDANGSLLLSIGQTGAAPGEFWIPNGIAIGSDDRIYVADVHNRRIQIFSQVKEQ